MYIKFSKRVLKLMNLTFHVQDKKVVFQKFSHFLYVFILIYNVSCSNERTDFALNYLSLRPIVCILKILI